jgi:transcriptional regulator with XRE-family HTH domain
MTRSKTNISNPPADPTGNRRRLRDALRQARREAAISQRQVARRLEWSPAKIARIEAGTVGLSVTDLKALAELYGISDQGLIDTLVAAARGSKGRMRWMEYREFISSQRFSYLQWESTASRLQVYHWAIIPDLAQTREYAAAMLSCLVPHDHIRPLVKLLEERQHQVGERNTQLDIIVDEAAVRRCVGGPAVMRHQLLRLREMSEQPQTTLTLVPFTTHAYAGLGPFTRLTTCEGNDILFTAGPGEPFVSTEADEEFTRYYNAATQTGNRTLNGDAATAVLDDYIQALDATAPAPQPDERAPAPS